MCDWMLNLSSFVKEKFNNRDQNGKQGKTSWWPKLWVKISLSSFYLYFSTLRAYKLFLRFNFVLKVRFSCFSIHEFKRIKRRSLYLNWEERELLVDTNFSHKKDWSWYQWLLIDQESLMTTVFVFKHKF